MLNQERYPDSEYEKIRLFAAQSDNAQAMIEVDEHRKFFGKRVKVVKGRKCPIGAVGVVFYLCRKQYGQNQWFGFSTRVGIKTDNGETLWTSTDNIELLEVAKCSEEGDYGT